MLHKKPLIGVSVDCYQGLSPSMLIGALKIIGINFVEVTTSVFSETDQVISKINGIKTAFHLPLIHDNGYDLSCVEKQDEINKLVNNLNTYKDALNIQHVISHPPEPQEAKQPMETSIDFLVENLKKIKHARLSGKHSGWHTPRNNFTLNISMLKKNSAINLPECVLTVPIIS